MGKDYHIEARPFLVRWIAYSIIIWPMAIFCVGLLAFGLSIVVASFQNLTSFFWLNTMIWLITVPISGAIVGFCVGHLQRGLLRKRLYWAADHWRNMSMVGGVVGTIIVVGLIALLDGEQMNSDDLLILAMPIFMLCVSIAQWIRLRHAVRAAWLWIVSNVAGGMVFSGLVFMNQPDWYSYNYSLLMMGIWFVGIIAQGAITGQIMLHLFQTQLQPMQPETVTDGDVDNTSKSVWDEAI